jgi:RHS repeat-associated protein
VGTIENLYDVHSDHLDTPCMLTDSYGIPSWRASYEAFGKAHVSDDPDGSLVTIDPGITFNLRFPGQYYDAESGLHDNFYRSYDPNTGRYISADPIGQLGILRKRDVAQQRFIAPEILGDINTYRYGFGDPVDTMDPHGLGRYTAAACVLVAAKEVWDMRQDAEKLAEAVEEARLELQRLDKELRCMELTDPGYLEKVEEAEKAKLRAVKAAAEFAKARQSLAPAAAFWGLLCTAAAHPGLP